MSIPQELDPYIQKILAFVGFWIVSFIALFFLRIALTSLITSLFGEENAVKLVGAIFLTPSKLIFDQYGIELYSFILVVGLAFFSEKNKTVHSYSSTFFIISH